MAPPLRPTGQRPARPWGGRAAGLALSLLALCGTAAAAEVDEPLRLEIDRAAPAHAFPHVWEVMMGSGRAALALRQAWHRDLALVTRATGLRSVRFHAIFHDELGLYGEDAAGRPVLNFQYVDQIYDGMLEDGVRPAIELGFMPRALARRADRHPFWYHPIVSPPKDWDRWDELIRRFAGHLVERYGIDEVALWSFEVWNEPNLDFWTGRPAQRSYFDLYDHTARALKAVSPRLRVGGPATAQAAWVPAFIAHAAEAGVPVDFVSTHIYGDEDPVLVPGMAPQPRGYDLVCPAIRLVHDQIARSPRPDLPLMVTEFNATSNSRDPILASPRMAPWLAQTIRDCDGLAQILSYWTFSDVFEEQGVIARPFEDGFGLVGLGGVPKPVFAAFALLHRLGTERLAAAPGPWLVTRRPDGSLAIAVWNRGPAATASTVDLAFRQPESSVRVSRVDAAHGDPLPAFRRLGSPAYPSPAQLDALREAADPGPAETVPLADGRLRLTLPPDGLALVELDAAR